jgi:hypothetical protein
LKTDVGKVQDPSLDLSGKRLPLLKIFQHDRWEVKPEDLDLLKPSIQLASNIVRVGLPYIASFLPPRDGMFDDGEFYDQDGQRENLCPREITLKDNPSENEVAAALESLENLAPFIRWQTNNEMFAVSGEARGEDNEALGWMGITRLVDEPRPWGIITEDMVVEADASSKTQGLAHRPLIIAIMGEYVKAIGNSPKGSEQRLRATFMAGITMAHEVGHAIFHQDFRSYNPPTLEEPYVGNDCSSELGISFIKWIFGGFHPDVAELKDHKLTDFAAHLDWTENYCMGIERRPLYKTLYSISIPWIEEKLTQGWWDGLPSHELLIDFSSKAKEGLKPVTDPKSNESATARLPEWLYSWMFGSAKWNYDFNFRKRGYRPGDKVEGLSEEEIAWAKANQAFAKHDAVFASKSPEELKQAQRIARMLDHESAEDEEEEGFMRPLDDDPRFGGVPASKDDIVELHIEDGVLEKDVHPPREKDETPLTRIIVRYLPDEDTSAKRPRDDDDKQGRRPVKRAKVSTEIKKFLEKSSPFSLAREMTRMEIHNLCASRKIPGYTLVEPNEYWQQAHPDLDDGEEDLWVAVALSNDMIDTALVHLFPDDIDAKIKLKQTSLDSVQDWGWPQLRQFCESNGIDFRGAAGTAKVRDLVQDWKRAEIESLQAASDDQSQSLESQTDDLSANPEKWTLDELQNFCQQNDLPSTGTKTSLIIRTKRHKREQAKGVVHPRRPQHHRLDANGFEVYSFRAILAESTVGSLKSALFVAGNFHPSATLSLYFGGSIFKPLRDDEALLTYNTPTPDWTTLRLKVASKWKTGPGSSPATAIDVDAPRPKIKFSTPLPLPETSLASAAIEPSFPVVTFGDQLTPLERAAAARADPKVQREAEVLLGGANPTFSELLTSIGNRAPKLDQMMLAGGKFQQVGRASRSGLEILEEVEDYEEGEEQRKKSLEALMKEPGMGEGEERDPVEGYPKPGSSHMADLFWAQNKKFNPRDDEGDEHGEGFGGL